MKAQINLVYDQYNGGSSFKTNNRVFIRPFPNVKTPTYFDRWNNVYAKYEVVEGNKILSQFIELDRAKDYAVTYVSGNLGIELLRITSGNEEEDYIEAYDTCHNINNWVYVRKIKKEI